MSKYSDGKTYKVVALCLAKFHASEQIDLMRKLHAVCKRRNVRVVVFASTTDFAVPDFTDPGEEFIYSLMDPTKFDAVLISGESFKVSEIPERIAKRAMAANVPVFALFRHMDGCINIRFDYGDAFEKIVRHIVEDHGFTRINLVAGIRDNEYSNARVRCFRRVLEEHNIPIDENRIGYGDFWERPTGKLMDDFMKSDITMPQAFICANDTMAMEVCRKLNEYGYKVPQDVVVTGFDGNNVEKYHFPRLTTAEEDLAGMCEVICSVLDDITHGLELKDEYIVNFRYRVSQSCGCIKSEVTENELLRLGIRYSLASQHENNVTNYFESFYDKVSKYGNKQGLNAVLQDMYPCIDEANARAFMLSLNNDLIDEHLELLPTCRPAASYGTHHYYTDDMVIAMDYFTGFQKQGEYFRRAEIVPDLQQYLSNNLDMVLLSPMHIQGSSIGYAATAFDADSFEYAIYYAYVMNLREIIEMHKYRLDQENLLSQDQLTKLFNRHGFYRHVEVRMANFAKRGCEVGLISIDMNWLKQINDTFGHAEGDFALSKIGELMRAVSGIEDVCTRFGGDEFAIAVFSENADKRSDEIINSLNMAIEAFNSTNVKPYCLSISVGKFVHVPDEEYDFERFILEADRVMYRVKTAFKAEHTWELFCRRG